MAVNINLPNFLQAETQSYAGPNLLESIMKGYKAAGEPRRMKMEEEEKRAMIEKLMLGNERARTENQYHEPMLQQAMEQGRQGIEQSQLNLNALPQRLDQEELARQLGLEQQQFQASHRDEDYERQKIMDSIEEAYKRGQINLQQAKTIAALASPQNEQKQYAPTTEQKNINALGIPEGSDQYKEVLSRMLNIPYGDVPSNAIPLQGMQVSERQGVRQLMNQDIEKSNAARDAVKTAKEMKKFLDQNKDISESMTAALFDPDDKDSWHATIKRFGSDKAKLSKLEIFSKLAADLQLQQGRVYGGSKGATDSLRSLIAQSKVGAKNTDEAKKYIIDKIIEQGDPLIRYGKDARAARKNGNYAVLYDPEAYEQEEEDLSNLSDEELDALERRLRGK
jgi:hypothetical protein